ncbi:MAG: hypothetical protein Q9159_005067 [Coniocarpon cinnabarinum]
MPFNVWLESSIGHFMVDLPTEARAWQQVRGTQTRIEKLEEMVNGVPVLRFRGRLGYVRVIFAARTQSPEAAERTGRHVVYGPRVIFPDNRTCDFGISVRDEDGRVQSIKLFGSIPVWFSRYLPEGWAGHPALTMLPAILLFIRRQAPEQNVQHDRPDPPPTSPSSEPLELAN